MKLDPGIHIVMHSVLSLKPGVTLERDTKPTECSNHPPEPTNRVKLFDTAPVVQTQSRNSSAAEQPIPSRTLSGKNRMWAAAPERLTADWLWASRSNRTRRSRSNSPEWRIRLGTDELSGSTPRILNLIPIVMPRGREINPRREKSQEEEQIRGGEGRRTLSPEEHRVLS